MDYLHGLGIVHCDLKPENILIKSYSRCEIKVIDLGSSCFENDRLSLYVQSRSYRAPEVILGLPYNQKVDLWSLGCILAELASGDVCSLFSIKRTSFFPHYKMSLLNSFEFMWITTGFISQWRRSFLACTCDRNDWADWYWHANKGSRNKQVFHRWIWSLSNKRGLFLLKSYVTKRSTIA